MEPQALARIDEAADRDGFPPLRLFGRLPSACVASSISGRTFNNSKSRGIIPTTESIDTPTAAGDRVDVVNPAVSRAGKNDAVLDDSLLAEAFGLVGLDPAQRLKQGVGVLAQQGRTADRDG